MVKYILALALLGGAACYGQDTKPKDEKPPEAAYEKYVKVKVEDVPIFIDALNKWKDLEAYNPKTTDKQKVETMKAIDAYLAEFLPRVKVDSSLIINKKKP